VDCRIEDREGGEPTKALRKWGTGEVIKMGQTANKRGRERKELRERNDSSKGSNLRGGKGRNSGDVEGALGLDCGLKEDCETIGDEGAKT